MKMICAKCGQECSDSEALTHRCPIPKSVIVNPPHYNATRFEVWDVLDEWFPTNPLLWNVGKYIARANHKGKMIEDLKKAQAYLAREIARLESVSSSKENE